MSRLHKEGKFEGQRLWMRENAGKIVNPSIPKYCKECNKMYSPQTRGCQKIYCSTKCEKISRRKKAEERWCKIEKYCANCGERLIPKMNKRGYPFFAKTCSDSCFRQLASKMKMGSLHPMHRMTEAVRQEWFNKTLKKGWDAIIDCPNKFERRVIEFINKHELPFEFVGDGKEWIGPCESGRCRNPDFVCTWRGVKKVILAHGTYWHRDLDGVEEEILDYKGEEYLCFIVWEDEKLNRRMLRRLHKFLYED